MDYYDAYGEMTAEEEEAAWEEYLLDLIRWPIEDDGYEASLDAQASMTTPDSSTIRG